jgi:hydroxyacylglutathione hydrolase
MFIQQFFVDGLGCASYLVGCESKGVAAVVDPDRDVRKYQHLAGEKGLKITHIIETHLHADHVSGNSELAARTGADIYIHKAAEAEFEHKTMKDGDVIELGAVKLLVQHTPGHTPESVTLLLSDTTRSDTPWMALTGDLLFVGDVGRPDLVGIEAARGLAGELHESLFNKLLRNDDGVMVFPGHGAGSLCGRSIGSVKSSTIGFERRFNPALAVSERNAFIDYMTSNLPEQPGNHRRIKAINRTGPEPLGSIEPKPLSIDRAIPLFRRGAALLDTREKAKYIEEHVSGSINLPADDQLSNRVGFILHPDYPIVVLLNDEREYEQVVYSLARVGFEKVAGYLAGGMKSWRESGLPVASGDIQDITPAELHELLKNGNSPLVLDVREPWEYTMGHVPGAVVMPLGQVGSRLEELDPSRPVAVVCATGSRSQSAAALLGQKGFRKIYNLLDGTDGWQRAGFDLELEHHTLAETSF